MGYALDSLIRKELMTPAERDRFEQQGLAHVSFRQELGGQLEAAKVLGRQVCIATVLAWVRKLLWRLHQAILCSDDTPALPEQGHALLYTPQASWRHTAKYNEWAPPGFHVTSIRHAHRFGLLSGCVGLADVRDSCGSAGGWPGEP